MLRPRAAFTGTSPDATALHCDDAAGLAQTIHLPLTADVGIAPDGTIWLSGAQIARLSQAFSVS